MMFKPLKIFDSLDLMLYTTKCTVIQQKAHTPSSVHWIKQIQNIFSSIEFSAQMKMVTSKDTLAEFVNNSVNFLLDNIFIRYDNKIYRQVVEIPVGTNCTYFIADLFFYFNEYQLIVKLQKYPSKSVFMKKTILTLILVISLQIIT